MTQIIRRYLETYIMILSIMSLIYVVFVNLDHAMSIKVLGWSIVIVFVVGLVILVILKNTGVGQHYRPEEMES